MLQYVDYILRSFKEIHLLLSLLIFVTSCYRSYVSLCLNSFFRFILVLNSYYLKRKNQKLFFSPIFSSDGEQRRCDHSKSDNWLKRSIDSGISFPNNRSSLRNVQFNRNVVPADVSIVSDVHVSVRKTHRKLYFVDDHPQRNPGRQGLPATPGFNVEQQPGDHIHLKYPDRFQPPGRSLPHENERRPPVAATGHQPVHFRQRQPVSAFCQQQSSAQHELGHSSQSAQDQPAHPTCQTDQLPRTEPVHAGRRPGCGPASHDGAAATTATAADKFSAAEYFEEKRRRKRTYSPR
jgi:hypothetical protein